MDMWELQTHTAADMKHGGATTHTSLGQKIPLVDFTIMSRIQHIKTLRSTTSHQFRSRPKW